MASLQALLLFNTSGESGSGDLDSNQCGQWEAMTKLDSVLKSRDITLLTKVCIVKPTFSSSHVWMWELDSKESWVPKNWCFWIVMLEKTLASPLDSKIKLVNPKGNQPWIFTGRTDAEAPILWPPDGKRQLIGKDPDPGKDWRQKEKGVAEDETDNITDSIDMNLSKIWETVKDRGAWHAAVHGVAKRMTQLSNWTATKLGLPLDCSLHEPKDSLNCFA